MLVQLQSDYNHLSEAVALAVRLFSRQEGEEVRLVERRHLFLHDGVDEDMRFADYKRFLERIFAQGEPLAAQFSTLRPFFVGDAGEPGIVEVLLTHIPVTSIHDCSLAHFQRAVRLALWQMDLMLREGSPEPAEVNRIVREELSLAEAFRIVEASEMEADQKLLYLKLIQDSTTHYEMVRELLGQLEAVLQQELPSLAAYLQDFLQSSAEKGAEEFWQDAVGDYLRLEEIPIPGPVNVFPSAVNYNRAVLRISVDQQVGSRLFLGLLFQPLNRLKQKAARLQDVVLGQLKAISDPTRFEILRLLAERTRYTKELAEHLNLTSSTLSHHMALLMGEDLVDIRLKGRRSYYSLRVAELMKLADVLQTLARQAAQSQLED